MIKIDEIILLLDHYKYIDARVKVLECNYFADEVTLVFEHNSTHDIKCVFSTCYKVIFDHDKSPEKWGPVKDMNYGQIPYFIYEISMDQNLDFDFPIYVCKIDMGLLNLEIWFGDLSVNKIGFIDTRNKSQKELFDICKYIM